MAKTTLVGLVFYADDPEQRVFRKVYPDFDDSELDDPQWTSVGCDPQRRAVLKKVQAGSVEAAVPMNGLP